MATLSGCTTPDRSEIVGTYTLDDKRHSVNLTLLDDSTYTQDVDDKSSHQREKCSGTWTYDSTSGDVKLEGALVVLSNIKGSTQKQMERHIGIVLLPATRQFGRLTLGTDEGEVYVRGR